MAFMECALLHGKAPEGYLDALWNDDKGNPFHNDVELVRLYYRVLWDELLRIGKEKHP